MFEHIVCDFKYLLRSTNNFNDLILICFFFAFLCVCLFPCKLSHLQVNNGLCCASIVIKLVGDAIKMQVPLNFWAGKVERKCEDNGRLDLALNGSIFCGNRDASRIKSQRWLKWTFSVHKEPLACYYPPKARYSLAVDYSGCLGTPVPVRWFFVVRFSSRAQKQMDIIDFNSSLCIFNATSHCVRHLIINVSTLCHHSHCIIIYATDNVCVIIYALLWTSYQYILHFSWHLPNDTHFINISLEN